MAALNTCKNQPMFPLDWKAWAAIGLILSVRAASAAEVSQGAVLNDVHSRLNATRVGEYHEPESKASIAALIERADRSGLGISISGGRHAMGGQQFGEGTLH